MGNYLILLARLPIEHHTYMHQSVRSLTLASAHYRNGAWKKVDWEELGLHGGGSRLSQVRGRSSRCDVDIRSRLVFGLSCTYAERWIP